LLASLAFAATAFAQQMLVTDAEPKYQVRFEKNGNGAHVENRMFPDGTFHKIIEEPLIDPRMDYDLHYDMITDLTDRVKQMKDDGHQPIYTCSNREPNGNKDSAGAFIPVYVTDLTTKTPTATFTDSSCFEQIDFNFEQVDDKTWNVHIKTGKKKSTTCRESFVFANTEIFHIEIFAFKGDHTLTFTTATPEAQADMAFGGLKVYQSCDGIVDILKSAFNMVKCFVGGISSHSKLPYIGSHVPPYMEKANVEFLHEAMGYDLEPRTTKKVEIDPDLI